MSSVASLSHYVRNLNSRETRGVGDAHLTNPQLTRNPFVKVVEESPGSSPSPDSQGRTRRKMMVEEDRRRVNQRIRHQTMLSECRSGVARRHHNQRENDIAEHVDLHI